MPGWERLTGAMRTRRLARGEYLFRAGEQAGVVYVIDEGLVKMVYETRDGQEWIKAFAGSRQFFASLSALQPGGAASFSALALKPTVVESIDYQAILRVAEHECAWQRLLARAFEIYGSRKETREMSLLTQTAEERYRRFLREQPDLAAQISQKDLAAFIRVTPVALSRIKARMR